MFDSTGGFITRWGSTGAGDGQFKSPRSVAIDLDGNVYVADANNHRIQVFDLAGAFVSQWGSQGPGDGQFNVAVGVATDPAGNVFVAESFPNNRVQVFGDLPPTIPELVEAVEALELPKGLENSLTVKLLGAQAALARGNTDAACGKLGAFANELEAQSGKKIASDAAEELIADVRATAKSVGCEV